MTSSRRFGLFGHPVSHSLSPRLHEAALKYCGIDGTYELFDAEPRALLSAIEQQIADGLNGFNVTIPHKQAVFELCARERSEIARRVGAVNTVSVNQDGQLRGDNTDVAGLASAVKDKAHDDLAYGSLVLLGTGGAAQAVIATAIELKLKKLTVIGRDQERSDNFMDSATQRLGAESAQIELSSKLSQEPYDLAINASSIGLSPGNDQIPTQFESALEQLKNKGLFVDLVYRKDGSLPLFAHRAQSLGYRVMDGLPMLIHQARYAFQIWTGELVPFEVMAQSVRPI